ncbi:MAG: type II toxin-antitoxin system Phd/YefM family antitoxin [Proteobacteria bacterium]|nr:type II toxin-antitoxin system Phd/YefM family antitoxin [Pseudomonadota bacterium]
MASVPSIIPISELRQDTAGVIKKTHVSEEPVFITQRGRATAVLVSTEAYEKTQYELGLLRAIAKGEAEAALGVGEDLDHVFDKIDAKLAGAK